MSKKTFHIHRSAGVISFLIILSFFISTVLVELLGDSESIVLVKTYIAYAVWILIPMMIITGKSGISMSPKKPKGFIAKKKKRLPFIAFNGLFILVPAATYLRYLAIEGSFDFLFYSVQAIELIAGFINLTLMSLNIRDGILSVRSRQNNK
ncbi:hypothetical protein L4C34_14645 [Vibrio profundum]|uniref:hypothetical protein n=1 Tax=Vibrio profundum TaxID=2910247 RepID=UPI003D0FA95D